MPYYESTSEEAERIAQERHVQPIQVLIRRSQKLREIRRELGVIAGLIQHSKRRQALEKIDKLISEIGS